MEDIVIVVRYYFRILLRSLRATFTFELFRGRILEIILYVLALGILSFLSTYGLERVGWIAEFKLNIETGLIVLGIFLSLSILANLVYIPAKLYKDLGGFLNVPILLASASDKPKPQTNVEVWASLRVNNPTKVDVHNCQLRLEDAVDLVSGLSVLRATEYLTWSAREHYDGAGNTPKKIKAEDHRICDVAQTDSRNNRAMFDLAFGVPQTVPPGRYRLTVCATGDWGEDTFGDKKYFELVYNGGYDLLLLNPIE